MEGDLFPQDVYPVRLEDIPRIHCVLIELWNDLEKQKPEINRKGILLELANSLCNMDGERKLTDEIESENVNKAETLRNILELWVKQNAEQGTVANLQTLAFKLRSMKCLSQGKIESFFVDYSLPAIKGESEKVVYSLSKPHLNLNLTFSPVFNNSLILEEIFKNLSLPDRKIFRLVNRFWRDEVLGIWRKHATINIRMRETNFEPFILMNEFLQGFNNSEESIANRRKQHLFRSYAIWFTAFSPEFWKDPHPTMCSLNNKDLNEFWERFGPHVENLRVCDAILKPDCYNDSRVDTVFFKIIKSCRNLKKFCFFNCADWYDSRKRCEFKTWPKIVDGGNPIFAENLQTLHLDVHDLHEKSLERILWLCPNIKTLSVETDKALKLLFLPGANGNFIQLRELSLDFGRWIRTDFLGFCRFTSSELSFSLENLQLINVNLKYSRFYPFYFYEAISQCCRRLKSLKIKAIYNNRNRICNKDDKFCGPLNEKESSAGWFIDLCPFQFCSLTKLECVFELHKFTLFNCSPEINDLTINRNDLIIFDFATLKNMPCLEELSIKFELNKMHPKLIDAITTPRFPGATDWIFKGSKSTFLPDRFTRNYEENIVLENLKRFTFLCWNLNQEDVKILSGWFPNLTYLKAGIASTTKLSAFLSGVLGHLRQLHIVTERLIPLREVRDLREKRKLEIEMEIRETRQLVEVKECNGHLYFNNIKENKNKQK